MSKRGWPGWWAALVCLALGAGEARAVSFERTVALGDSLTAPAAVRGPNHVQHVMARLGLPFTNLARGGATSSSLVATQLGPALDLEPTFVFLWIGGNDAASVPVELAIGNWAIFDTIEANIETAVSALRAIGADVAVANLWDAAREPLADEYLEQYVGTAPDIEAIARGNLRNASHTWAARLRALAARHGAAFVDVVDIFEQIEADGGQILGVPVAMAPAAGGPTDFFWDDIHPSSLGMGFLTNRWITALNDFYGLAIPALDDVELGALAGLSLPACADGADDDGDGLTDFPADPGCTDLYDLSEVADCSDGVDNDRDGDLDFPDDDGCPSATAAREDPPCDDGRDNEGDGRFDHDGAGRTVPDPDCAGDPLAAGEGPIPAGCVGCGAGGGVALLPPIVWALTRRCLRRRA